MDKLKPSKEDIDKNRDIAALSYLWVLSIFILYLRKDSYFIKYHARQASVLFILSVIFWVIPYIKYLNIIIVVFLCIGAVESYMGNYYKIPILGDIIEDKFNFKRINIIPRKIRNFSRKLFNRDKNISIDSLEERIIDLETEIRYQSKIVEELKRQLKLFKR